MTIIYKLLRMIDFGFKSISLFSNWYLLVTARNKPNIIKMRNGLKFYSNGNIADFVVLVENFKNESQYDSHLNNMPKIIIDIGANIGAFTAYIKKKYPKVKIFCYEPDPLNFSNLQKNMKTNGFDDVLLVKKGVDKSTGKKTLYAETDRFGTANSSTIRKSETSMEIECTSLSDIMTDNKIESCSLLKIDCEGAEYDILLNTPKSVLQKFRLISIEYHRTDLHDWKDITDYLGDIGFRCHIRTPKRNQMIGYINAVNDGFLYEI